MLNGVYGSCTNGRIEDLRAAAAIPEGQEDSGRVRAMRRYPVRALCARKPRKKGLGADLIDCRPFEWASGVVQCVLAMNPISFAGEPFCAEPVNRNFEGRQGRGDAPSDEPAMAAGSWVTGHLTDVARK